MENRGKTSGAAPSPRIVTALSLQPLDGNRIRIPGRVAKGLPWLRKRPRKTGCRILVIQIGRALVLPGNDEEVPDPLAFVLDRFLDPASPPEAIAPLEPAADVGLRAAAALSQISSTPPAYRLHLPPDLHPLLELDPQTPRLYLRSAGHALEIFSVQFVRAGMVAASQFLRHSPESGGNA